MQLPRPDLTDIRRSVRVNRVKDYLSQSLLLSEVENTSLLKVILTLESQRKKQGHDDPVLRIGLVVTKDFVARLEQQTLQLLPNPLLESSAISLYQSKGEQLQGRVWHHPVRQ